MLPFIKNLLKVYVDKAIVAAKASLSLQTLGFCGSPKDPAPLASLRGEGQHSILPLSGGYS